MKPLVEARDVQISGEQLAKTYYNIGAALTHLARRGEAAVMWEHTTKLREWLLTRDVPVAQELAETYLAMARYCTDGYPEGAIILCNRTIGLLAKANDRNPKRLVMLAEADVIKGLSLGSQGQYGNGALITDRGIAKLARLATLRSEVRPYLAEAVARRAMMAEAARRKAEAQQHWDRAIALYQEVVFKDGRYELQSELDQFIAARERLATKRPA